MKLVDKIKYSALLSLPLPILSLFVKIVPCKIFPNVFSAYGNWGTCILSKGTDAFGVKKIYFGITESMWNSLFFMWLSAFLLLLLMSKLFKSKK